MGISKDVALPTSVVCNYHKIDSVPNIEWNEDGTGKMTLAISQYVSYEAKEAGALPVRKKHETFSLDEDITGIFRYLLYKTVLPIAPEFKVTETVQDGEVGNMLRLLHYLNPDEMAVIMFALQDMLELLGTDIEPYREWYDRLKDSAISTLEV